MTEYKNDIAKANALAVGNTFKLAIKMMLALKHPLMNIGDVILEYTDNKEFKEALTNLETLTLNKPLYETAYKPIIDLIEYCKQPDAFTKQDEDIYEQIARAAYTLNWIDLRAKSGYWPKDLDKISSTSIVYDSIIDEVMGLIENHVSFFTELFSINEDSLLNINPTYTDSAGKVHRYDFILNNSIFYVTTTQDFKGSNIKNNNKINNFLHNIPEELKEFDIDTGVVYYPRHRLVVTNPLEPIDE